MAAEREATLQGLEGGYANYHRDVDPKAWGVTDLNIAIPQNVILNWLAIYEGPVLRTHVLHRNALGLVLHDGVSSTYARFIQAERVSRVTTYRDGISTQFDDSSQRCTLHDDQPRTPLWHGSDQLIVGQLRRS